jgi:hypothetical protein
LFYLSHGNYRPFIANKAFNGFKYHFKIMKKIVFFIFTLFTVATICAQNSIKKVIVETYYVSDANDASDTTGGGLEIGSKTYRIYIQMKPGCQIMKLYGDANHALKISSTDNFFNNKDRGKTFAKDISKSNYTSNTVALDTWLTLGQTTKNSTNTYFGILKSQDNDGSFIGGANNDGGSAGIINGLLTNNNSAAGIPLTTADGMALATVLPINWSDNGIVDLLSGIDSTIFGSVKTGKEFISNNAYLQNSGVMGVNPDSNQVLLAQLTTKGDITFELNVEIKETDGSITKYVAKNNLADEVISSYLKYPPDCGCMDPAFFEYNSYYNCNISDSCKTRIILGCMDPNACNYDPNANYNVQELCCYPGKCADRDISLVCPDLGKEFRKKIKIYPNPANDQITLEASIIDNVETKFVVYNSFGNVETEKNLGSITGDVSQILDISSLKPGIYLVRMISDKSVISNTFIKN